MNNTEYVILVDKQNRPIGRAEKIAAHRNNLLHRAFSVFIFKNPDAPELLIQQRALEKYHSPGLWTNTCCSHPRENESIIDAGERRLKEEFGISAKLKDLGWFHYNAHFSNGLSENEIDHVLIGIVADDIPIGINPNEIHDFRWVNLPTLEAELKSNKHNFTPWFEEAFTLAKKGL